jgi:hypothetical protein
MVHPLLGGRCLRDRQTWQDGEIINENKSISQQLANDWQLFWRKKPKIRFAGFAGKQLAAFASWIASQFGKVG